MLERVATGLVLRLLTAAFLALAVVAGGMAPVAAQERVERKSLLQLLFGGGPGARKAPPPDPAARTSRPKAQRKTRPAAQPAEEAVAKIENARKVLVIGDFLASGLAEGLTAGFAKSPGVVIVDKTNGSSGLVRQDYYNWTANAPAILAEVQPDVIVVQIGSNDSQQMTVNGEREQVRSAKWLAEYERRTDELIAALSTARRPIVWVGLPSFNFASMSADMVALNGLFRMHVEQAGGEFIDIWDGFVDEEGKFVFTGSDINGQQARLRGSDGVNMTQAGRRKMAFYAEKSIRRILGDAADTDIATLGADNLPELSMPPAPVEAANPVRTLPVSMTDPELDGGTTLLGGPVRPVNATPTPRDLLVEKGIAPPAPEGRADNFRWPPAAPTR
jgi:Uncharacterized protein conserved in bacteria